MNTQRSEAANDDITTELFILDASQTDHLEKEFLDYENRYPCE